MSKTSIPNRQFALMRHPAEALETAIDNLIHFSSMGTPSTLTRVGKFILSTLSTKARIERENDKLETRAAVLQAINTIKRHYPFIRDLEKNGNHKEKKLADSILSAITQYHTILDAKKTVTTQWRNSRVAQFFCGTSVLDSLKKHRIDLPLESLVQWSISKNGNSDKILLTFQSLIHANSITPSDPLLMQEKDALQLKAGTLLQNQGITFKTITEKLMRIRNAPILSTYDSENDISNLILVLDLLPGTTVQIMGSFKRSQTTKTHSTPIPESFQLTFQSSSTGFPHPIQHTGWALSELLLPPYPHCLDQLPLFKELYERRKNLSVSLDPNGPNFEHAKQLHSLKEQVLEENRVDFLKLHQKLFHAIIGARIEEASSIVVEAETQSTQTYFEAISCYFSRLETSTRPFTHLAETWKLINNCFVNQPYARLQQIWLERSEPDLFHAEPNIIQQTARKIIEEEQIKALELLQSELNLADTDLSKDTLKFINCIKILLADCFKEIVLQSCSETLRCAPRMLDDLSQKLQLIACMQLTSFLEEFEWKLESIPKVHIKSLIKQKIEQDLLKTIGYFKSDSFDSIEDPQTAIIEEFEFYFNSVFFNDCVAKS